MMSATLRNLISNAIKFSHKGSNIFIKGSLSNNKVNLSVIDNGIGIAPDMIEKLFTFNVKIRKPGTDGETGTGMGLGLCMEFMQLNKGTIMVSSKKGQGSTFTMLMQPASLNSIPAEHVHPIG
jgi:signal transduction histidine kinase